jgi:ABC-type phosphate/phosphonate transport system permease subunit
MQAQNDPKIAAMMQTLQTSGTGTTVALSFAVPADVFRMIHSR